MKKLIFLLCFLIFPLLAQEVNNNTFNETNPNLVRNNEPHTYSGGSLIYIQGISDKPQPKTWLDHAKIRLYGSMEIPKKPEAPLLNSEPSIDNISQNQTGVFTKSFFGKNKELKYISHTSDWNFIIQIMDNQNIYIRENLQFLITENSSLSRPWDIDTENFFLLRATLDGKNIKNLLQKGEIPSLNITSVKKGAHKITLEYLLKRSTSTNRFSLPLIHTDWPYEIDKLSGVILTGETKITKPSFLFGENQVEIPENFTVIFDKENNLYFENDYIIPAFSKIKLTANTIDKSQNISTEEISNKFSPVILFLISFFILFFYLLLGTCEIYFEPLIKQMKRFNRIHKQPLINWLHRMGELIIGVLILLILTLLISLFLNISLPFNFWFTLIFLSILGIIISDIFVYPKQKEIFKIHQQKTRENK